MRLQRTARASGVAAILLLAAGAFYEHWGERRDARRLPQVGRSVDIGGRSLNIHCTGEGTPAVIFDAGNGASGIGWSPIQTRVAARTRACWFDRAGEGWSDPGPFPRTSAAMSADLHELLHRSGMPPPYVLVGHSLGGLNVRVYNGLYPEDVAGAVLVDAAHEDEPRRAPPFMIGRSAPRALWHPIWMAGQTARAIGLLRMFAPRPDDPRSAAPRQIAAALARQPKSMANRFDASGPDSYAQAERSAGFGDKPLVVLTRGRVPALRENPSEMDRQGAAYEQVWMHEIQPKLARLSTRGRQILVPDSGHDVPAEAPAAVVDAVERVVSDVRGSRREIVKQ